MRATRVNSSASIDDGVWLWESVTTVCGVAIEPKPKSVAKNVIKMLFGMIGKMFFRGTVAGFWVLLEVVVR
ncbi:MAG: hypothetical protein QF718_00595 [Phycisphaerales bacterium]|nr:hypothetical protein [Phycisphaerales bacterium]